MVVETDAKANQLVEAIAEHSRVKAAALLGESGTIERIEGEAKVFRDGASENTEVADDGDVQHEDVFIESVVDLYLVVVFPVEEEFEPIKSEVDDLMDKLDL